MSKRTRIKKSDTKKTKIDESSPSANSQMLQTERTSEVPTMDIDESSSANQTKSGENTSETGSLSANRSEITTISQDKKCCVFDVGIQDFKEAILMVGYIDKTMLIREVINNINSRILLLAPRRFGKSINLTMLKYFFEISPDKSIMERNRKLFDGRKIAERCPNLVNEHQGKYPVIYFNFKSSGDIASITAAREFLSSVVQEAYRQHEYLRKSDRIEDHERESVAQWCDRNLVMNPVNSDFQLEYGLKNLAKYLNTHWDEKVVFLSDEYDAICFDAVINVLDINERDSLPLGRKYRKADQEIQGIIDISIGFLSCLSEGDYGVPIARAILTGISYLPATKLNRVEEHKFQDVHEFSKYYGVTFVECEDVLKKPEVNLLSEYEIIKAYYNGYRNDMLNVRSVMNYLNEKMTGRGEIENMNYWKESGFVAKLRDAFRISAIRSIISKLLSSISNEIEIDYLREIEYGHIRQLRNILNTTDDDDIENVKIFFNFLLEQGYLKKVKTVENVGIIVAIPNKEIAAEFYEKLKCYYESDNFNLDMELVRQCASLFDELSNLDEINKKKLKEIKDLLNMIFKKIKFNVKNEATVHHIIFITVFLCSKFQCFTEIRESEKNQNRLDILLLSASGLVIIIELKYNQSAQMGIKQILDRKYYDAVDKPEYNPKEIPVSYFLFLSVNMSPQQMITLSALLNYEKGKSNSFNLKKLFNCE